MSMRSLAAVALIGGVGLIGLAGCGSDDNHPGFGEHPDNRHDVTEGTDPNHLGGPHTGEGNDATNRDALSGTR